MKVGSAAVDRRLRDLLFLLLALLTGVLAVPAGAADDSPADEQSTGDGGVGAAIHDGDLSEQNPQVAKLTITFTDDSKGTCTGTFLNSRYILTAAHCFVLASGARAKTVRAVSGSTNFNPDAPGNWSSTALKRDTSVHPDYFPKDNVLARNDVALVRMPDPSPYSDPGIPYMGPSLEAMWGEPDSLGVLYGIGWTDPGTPTNDLYQAFFQPLDTSTCTAVANSAGATFDPDEAICAEGVDPDGNKDPEACPGDSGGPFIASTTDDQLAIGGTVSLGVFPSSTGPCVENSYVFFTRLARHVDWISMVSGSGPIAPLLPPVVDAGPARTIELGQAARLDGTATGQDSVRWSQVSGPGTTSVASRSAIDTTATFSQAGTYRLQLVATNGAGIARDEMTVIVQEPPSDGYFVLEADGELYAFGDARPLLNAMDGAARQDPGRGATVSSALRGRVAGSGLRAVAFELTADGRGVWVLLSDGRIVTLGNAPAQPGVQPGVMTKTVAGQPERVSALARLGSGELWVFTTAGRVIPQSGTVPSAVLKAMDAVLGLDLLGPVIDAKPTADGQGVLALASDGGVFTYNADEEFLGSVWNAIAEALGVPVGSVGPDRPVVGITIDPDGDGYWISAEDGGVFAMRGRSPFRGSLPALVPFDQLAAPIGGMVPFGNGYLLVGRDGGVFNFSNKPFAGSASGLLNTEAVALATL